MEHNHRNKAIIKKLKEENEKLKKTLNDYKNETIVESIP
jgi:hypothetical protein